MVEDDYLLKKYYTLFKFQKELIANTCNCITNMNLKNVDDPSMEIVKCVNITLNTDDIKLILMVRIHLDTSGYGFQPQFNQIVLYFPYRQFPEVAECIDVLFSIELEIIKLKYEIKSKYLYREFINNKNEIKKITSIYFNDRIEFCYREEHPSAVTLSINLKEYTLYDPTSLNK